MLARLFMDHYLQPLLEGDDNILSKVLRFRTALFLRWMLLRLHDYGYPTPAAVICGFMFCESLLHLIKPFWHNDVSFRSKDDFCTTAAAWEEFLLKGRGDRHLFQLCGWGRIKKDSIKCEGRHYVLGSYIGLTDATNQLTC